MNKAIVFILLALAGALASCSTATRLQPGDSMSRELKAAGENVTLLSTKNADKIATQVAASYKPWTRLSMDGDLKLDKVPLPTSVKVYMERGKLVIVSLRVMFMGEMGRVEITPDSILMVNKGKKVYVKEGIRRYLDKFGGDISNLQDLLLGRVFIMNAGTLTAQTAPLVDVSSGASDTWIVTPKNQDARAHYGFTLYPDGQMLMAAAFTTDEKYFASAEYDWTGGSQTMELKLKLGAKGYGFGLDFDSPNLNPKPIEQLKINSKWTKTDFKNWMKSLKF